MKLSRILQGAAALALVSISSGAAWASAPQAGTQAPGYYRMPLGDFEITALNDGTISLTMKSLLTRITPERIDADQARYFLKDPVETSVNGYLVNTGTKLVLIDTGAGSYFGPSVGNLVNALKAAGVQPEQVDEIYITHLHGDHCGGLVSGGKAVFPNAVVRVDRKEADYWLSKEHMDAAPQEAKDSYQGAMAAIAPYQALGHFKPFDGDTELVPGVRSVASHGHTAGHTTYLVESKGQKLALWGDLMHNAAVQFADPSVTIHFDTDSVSAAAERKKAYAEAAAQGYWVAAAHLSFPGIGHLRTEGSGYAWVPANYTSRRLHTDAVQGK